MGVIVGLTGIINIKTIDEADTFLYEKVAIPLGLTATFTDNLQRIRGNLTISILEENPQQSQAYQDRMISLFSTVHDAV